MKNISIKKNTTKFTDISEDSAAENNNNTDFDGNGRQNLYESKKNF